MKEIPLTRGKVALVDDADYDWLNQWKWCASKENSNYTFYAVRALRRLNGKKGNQSMHRLILGLQPGDKRQCDHRDGKGLNNQRSNLRICTVRQNQQSRRNLNCRTSRYKGTYWHRGEGKWCSQIRLSGKRTHLGLFNSETDAARAYDMAAVEHHGQFALTNEMLGLLT